MRYASPKLTLDNPKDRADFLRFMLFMAFVRTEAVNGVMRRALDKLALKLPEGETNDSFFDRVTAEVACIDTNVEMGTLRGSLVETDQGTARATNYDLTNIAPYITSLRVLVRIVRTMPADAFPEEARLTGEFMVRCEQVAKDPANFRPNQQ